MTVHGIDVASYQSGDYSTSGLDFVFVKATEGSSYAAETSPFAELPLTLGDAIAAFERNKVVRGCMPEELATQYIAVKSDEWARACGAVTDFDREMYLEYL